MSTTTLRIDMPLRQRILDLAQATGQSAHSFMIEALAQKTEEMEWQLALHKEAAERSEQLEATQLGLDWNDVRAWMLARAAGQVAQKPKAKSLKSMQKKVMKSKTAV